MGRPVMCLILFACQCHPQYPLIIAGNRDEYHTRPAAPAHFWEEAPHVLAGKDLQAGGTWFGITRNGRIAALTNYRDPASTKKNAPSRGELVRRFLMEKASPGAFLRRLEQKADSYNGFNLVFGIKDELYWYSNRNHGRVRLKSGLHGLSNHLLDTPWPKVRRGKKALAGLLSEKRDIRSEPLFQVLSDTTRAEDPHLPNTGIGIKWERHLSPIFIAGSAYGTRASYVVVMDHADHVLFTEKTFDPQHTQSGTVRFEFQLRP